MVLPLLMSVGLARTKRASCAFATAPVSGGASIRSMRAACATTAPLCNFIIEWSAGCYDTTTGSRLARIHNSD